MTKTILILAALATIGTAALAPTGASAFGHPGIAKRGGGHTIARAVKAPRPAKVGRPVNVGKIVNHALRLARPAWRRAPAFHPGRFVHTPIWHRPIVVGHPVYQAPTRVGFYPARVPMAQSAPVNGMNVVMVAVPNGQYSMTGQGQWAEQNSDGKTFQFTEANRDASSVTLNDAARGVEITLDLGQREVFYADRNSAKRPLYPIVNAAAK